jgi:hypothetical protein
MTSSTKTGQSSKTPSRSCHYNRKRIYLVPDIPDYDDPSLSSGAEIPETRESVGFSVYSILEPPGIRSLSGVGYTADNLASACRVGREAVEELVNDARQTWQKKRPGEEITNGTLLSKLGELDMKKSRLHPYKLTILETGPSQSEFEAHGFRKFKLRELLDLEDRENQRGRLVDVEPPTIHERHAVVVAEEKPDDCVIYDDDDDRTW